MGKTSIRLMRSNDLEPLGAIQPEGWKDIRAMFAYYLTYPACTSIVAEQDGRIVGSANGTYWGATGWVGPIIVDQRARGQGIGTLLTEAVMEQLHKQGCSTLLLIATELGQPVYEKLGFAVQGRYCFMKGGSELLQTVREGPVRPLSPSDLPAIERLDREASGEDRSSLLRKLQASGGLVVTDGNDGAVRGYFLRSPWGLGPIVADSPEAGFTLLQRAMAMEGHKSAAFHEDNTAAAEYLLQAGFTINTYASRMVLGESVAWKPQNIFARISGSFG
ncbi:GNAT family N-acetyltransferase [Paenibacillus sp. H1-7]|uniref:GNAT family N-acetyltransferase n=1 Tax=Paenibacillus sp. H1-7 TaxID=2282849 RepID=UPI001EF99834|nr:GNAT family N-acetyltransferase [Paenibacillus sp. H1-7]ULL13765.1 GNAT family N-acetyltransferase [Paenibacillus sp. H1-7]